MTLRLRVRRYWPLAFSALALWPVLHFVPALYSDIRFVLGGDSTEGWYSDFGEYRDAAGRPYYVYAYKVENIVYSGRGLYDDDTSEVYFRKPGDPLPLGVTYLRKKPWISTMKALRYDLKESAVLEAIPLLIFLGGLSLSLRLRRVRNEEPAKGSV